MSVREAVAQQDKGLTPSEQRIANFLVAEPDEAVFMPAAEVAERCDVHESTVIRLAQKLGFAGYAELRDSLRADARELAGRSSRVLRTDDPSHNSLASLARDEAEVLLRLPSFITQDQIDGAARTLLGAKRVYVTGNHYANVQVEYVDRRLRRLGYTTVPLMDEGRGLAERLVALESGDVLVAFALRKAAPTLPDLLAVVHDGGGRSIVITDVLSLQLQPVPTHLLAAQSGLDPVRRTPLVPLMISYAIQVALYELDTERFREALDRLDRIATRLGLEGPAIPHAEFGVLGSVR